jgi:ferrochelatase
MKHWHPYIAESVRQMADDGVSRAVGLVLAPHYSRMSVGRYIADAEEERDKVSPSMELRFVERWGMNPAFLEALVSRVCTAMKDLDGSRTLVLFTAHSLPERIRESNDPYESELLATAEAVAAKLSLPNWRFAFQSASKTGEPWIGPDILDVLAEERARGLFQNAVACPVGFVADHLEILYDLDVEAAELSGRLGLNFKRVPSLNADPLLVKAVVSEILSAAK